MIPKFRFFDTEENKMHVVDSLYTFKSFGGKDVTIATDDVELSEWRSYSDGVLMQSTGLFDKNGKEIFESEIVDVRTLEGTIYLRGIVKKVKGGFYIEGLYRSKNIPLTDFYFKAYTNTLEIKILGNKYQHPHLLEEE